MNAVPTRWFAAALLGLSLCAVSRAGEPRKPDPAAASSARDKASLEKEFAKTLTGAALLGQFTIDGKSDAKKAPDARKTGSDRYEIESAEKQAGDRWLITARVKYGKHDMKVPVPIDVFWAGDTPVMSLTKMTVPGLGTFTARVMFYGDRYAGTWQHDAVGGHMWGRIERADGAPLESPQSKKPPAPAKTP